MTYGVCGRLDRAVFVVDAPHERGDQHRRRANAARLVDVAQHVGAERRLWIRFAFRPLARFVVVSELDEIVVAAPCQRFLPAAFVYITLRAASVGGKVDHFDPLERELPEPGAPAGVVCHRRVPDQHDSHGSRGCDGTCAATLTRDASSTAMIENGSERTGEILSMDEARLGTRDPIHASLGLTSGLLVV